MREDLLIEQLTRIQEMMGIGPKNLLLEQRPDNLMPGQSDNPMNYTDYGSKEKTMFGMSDEELSTFKIGNGTDYPFVIDLGEPFSTLEVVEGTKVYTINQNTTSKELFGNQMTIRVGDVTDAEGNVKKNQPYLMVDSGEKDQMGMKKPKKACLPDNDFWTRWNGVVYKFTVPVRSEGGLFTTIKNNKVTFSLYLNLVDAKNPDGTGNVDGIGTAIACLGGSNGWNFKLDPPLFFTEGEGGTLIGYNEASTREGGFLDTRSDWEVWYDHYGLYLEIGIGVLSAFVGMGFASFLLNVGKAFGWSNALWTTLTASYGSTTVLSVFCQVIAEGVMMHDLIVWQMDNKREADAALCVIFCFLPFLTETRGISKLISGRHSKHAAATLTEKFNKVGLTDLFRRFSENQDRVAGAEIMRFMKSLTGDELALFNDALKIASKEESQAAFKKAVTEMVTSNANGKYLAEFRQVLLNEKLYKQTWTSKVSKVLGAGDKWQVLWGQTSKFVGRNLNPLVAKWVIPHQLARMGFPLVIFAISFKMAWHALSEEEKNEFEEKFNAALVNKNLLKYWAIMLDLDEKMPEDVINKSIETITSDPLMLKQVILGDNELIEKVIKEVTLDKINNSDLALTPEKNKNLLLVLRHMQAMGAKTEAVRNSIISFYKGMGFTDITVNPITNDNDVLGTLKYNQKEYTFRVITNENDVNYYVNNNLIDDSRIKNASEVIVQINDKNAIIARLESKDKDLEKDGDKKDVKDLEKDDDKIIDPFKKYCVKSKKGGWVETDEDTYNLTTDLNVKCLRNYDECSTCDKQEKDLYKYCVKKNINDNDSWTEVSQEEYTNQQYLAMKCIKSGVDLGTSCKTCQEQPKIETCKAKWDNKQIGRLQFIECKKRAKLKNWFI